MNYNNYIKNKRVILVGPSPSICMSKMGSFIDDFDIVIKTNAFIEKNNTTVTLDDYGKKTNIVYINMEYSLKLVNKLKANNTDINDTDYIVLKSIKPNNKELISLIKDSNIRTAKPFPQFVNKYKAAPMLGSIIINDIISNNPMELYVTGMDFYCGVPLDELKHKYGIGNVTKRQSHEYELDDASIEHMFISKRGGIHHVKQDFIYMYNMCINKKIKVDDNLKYLFKKYKLHIEKHK